MENRKKAFDSSVCFTFFGNWAEVIESFETDTDRNSKAYMLFKAIANYSMYGLEPDFDTNEVQKVFEPFWPMFADQIDQSIGRRKSGFGSEELTKKQLAIIKAASSNPNASYREIGRIAGASKSTVERTLKKYDAKIEASASATTFLYPGNNSAVYSSFSSGTGQRDNFMLQANDVEDELPF